MVTIHISYEGDLRCTAKHDPSGCTILTDAPLDNHGRGESFSPTDLAATAFATCAVTIMGIVAEREGIPLAGTTARVEKHMVADPHRRIDALPLHIKVAGDLTEDQRTLLENAARSCPVGKSLHPDLDQTITFSYEGE